MRENRRAFLSGSVSLGAMALAHRLWAQQTDKGMPLPPPHLGPSETEQPVARPQFDPRLIMEEHEKQFRAKLDQLYGEVRELKHKVDETPTAEIFSVNIYKQTKEIESLAKQLKKLAKS